MVQLRIFEYNGTPIEFEVIDGHVMANATKMCHFFGKKASDWLRLPQTQRYILAMQAKRENPASLFETRKGGSDGGSTWINEKLILKLAQWLDVEFEIWCDEKVAELIKNVGKLDKKEQPISALESHTKRPVQVTNAKNANTVSFEAGGKVNCIEWNFKVAKQITGYTPQQLKEIAKSKGVPSKGRTSGKEAARSLMPDKAAGISIADYLYSNGVDDNEAISLAETSIPVVYKLLEIQKNRALAS